MFQVHSAMEQAIDMISKAAEQRISQRDTKERPNCANEDSEKSTALMLMASQVLQKMSCEGTIYRSELVKKDLLALLSSDPNATICIPKCDSQALSYAQYIIMLAKTVSGAHEESASTVEKMFVSQSKKSLPKKEGERMGSRHGTEPIEDCTARSRRGIPSKEEHASWSLIAHCYCLYVTHLTSGPKIATKVKK